MKINSHLKACILFMPVLFVFNSCVTLMGGKHKNTVEIKTEPTGADVYDKNKVKLGTTPYTVSKMKENKMILSIQKEGYEDNEVEVIRHSKPGLLFLDAMLLCIPCIVDMPKASKLYDLETIEGTLKLRKKIEEHDKAIPVIINPVDLTFEKSKSIGKLNGVVKTMESTDIDRIAGYPDYYNEAVYASLGKGYFDTYYIESGKKADGLNRPKVSISVSVSDLKFDLKGKGLSTYSGNCYMKSEWKIYKFREKTKEDKNEKPLATIVLETSGMRMQGNSDYVIPSLLAEASKDFMGIDTMYDFINRLGIEAIIAQKGEVIVIKLPPKKSNVPEPKNKFKNAIQAVVTIEGQNKFGSGVVISPDGYIVTNNHVIEGEKKVSVKMSESIKLSADVVKTNPNFDLALIKISATDLKSLVFGNSDDVEIGDEVYAIGTPAAVELGQTLTKGIVSGKRELENVNYIQSDVSVSPGNSGGPLLNDKGQVIGITTMKIVSRGAEGLGFSIPSNVVLEMLNIKFQ